MRIVIIDQDEHSRAALASMLKVYALDEHCALVKSVGDAAVLMSAQDNAVCLLVVDAGEDVSHNLHIKQADQFTRPLRAGQLLDRVRRYNAGADGAATFDKTVDIGPYTLDTHNNELSGQETDDAIRLTDKETHILAFLAKQAGRFIDRQTLLDEVWGYAKSVETHTLETHIYRLRQKIEKDPSAPQILKTDENGYFIDIK